MIKVACVSYSGKFIDCFHDDFFTVDYYNKFTEIIVQGYDCIILFDDAISNNIISDVKIINNTSKIPIFILQDQLSEETIKRSLDLISKETFRLVSGFNNLIECLREYYIIEDISNKYIFKGLVVDYGLCQVYIDENNINLTTKEYDILKLLISRINTVISKEEIFKIVWDTKYIDDLRTLETHIKTLRIKLDSYRSNLITVWSKGYAFVDNQDY
ncbi:MAG: winged helix-turn-helix domain-containing protein [Bacilli bacterium]